MIKTLINDFHPQSPNFAPFASLREILRVSVAALPRAAFFAVNHSRLSWKDRCDDFIETPLNLRVVGDAPGHRDMARAAWRDPFLDQPPGINQNPRARTFFEPVLAQVPYFMTQFRQLRG